MHENAGVITNRLDWFENLIKKLEVNILTVSYRGYGDSEGEPTELGLKQDGRDITAYVNKHRNELVGTDGHIFLMGRALGGCLATYMAAHEDTPKDLYHGVILENTFTNIAELVDFIFPLFI